MKTDAHERDGGGQSRSPVERVGGESFRIELSLDRIPPS